MSCVFCSNRHSVRLGHEVIVTGEREKALRRDDLDSFDLIISDLSEAEVNGEPISELHRKHLVTPLGEQYKTSGSHQSFQDGRGKLPALALQPRRAARDRRANPLS